MAKQVININTPHDLINVGATANSKDGDALRTAFSKINDAIDKIDSNFNELYGADATSNYQIGDDTQFVRIELDGEEVPTGGVTIQSGYDTSMPVYIKGGNASQDGVGGNVVIEAGAPPLATPEQLIQGSGPYAGTVGNVEIAANQTIIDSLGHVWTFRDDGALETPNGQAITSDVNGVIVQSTNAVGIEVNNLGWVFDGEGRLNLPSLFPKSFTAFLDTAHNPDVVLEGDPWFMEVQFNIVGGQIETTVQQIFPQQDNPGYESGNIFYFTGDDHGIGGFGFTITLNDVVLPGPAGWTANVEASPPPPLPPTIQVDDTFKLKADATSWTFEPSGKLRLPDGGDIVDSNGNTVLGSGNANTGNFTFDGDIIDNASGAILRTNRGNLALGINMEAPGVPNHFHVAFEDSNANASANELYFGDDYNYLRLISSAQGVSIGTNDRSGGSQNEWRFDTDGSTTFPNNQVVATGEGSDMVVTSAGGLTLTKNNGDTWTWDSVVGVNDNVTISTNIQTVSRQWTFDTSGILTLPNNAEIRPNGTGIDLRAGSTGYAQIQNSDASQIVGVNDTSAYITTNETTTWSFDTDGRLTLPDTNTITVGITSSTGTQLTGIESYLGGGAPYKYVWNNATCPNFVSLYGLGVDIVGWTFYTVGQEGSAVTITEYAPIGPWSLGFSGDPGAGPYVAHSPDYAAAHTNPINIETNNNTWTFGADGTLVTPDYSAIQANTSLNLLSPNVGLFTDNTWINMDDAGNSITNKIQLTTNRNGGTLRKWEFDGNGTLTFPDTTTLDGSAFTLPENTGMAFNLTNVGGGHTDTNTMSLVFNGIQSETSAVLLYTTGGDEYFSVDGQSQRIEFGGSTGSIRFGTATKNDTGASNDIELYSYGQENVTGAVHIAVGGTPTTNRWTFNHDGRIYFPDGSVQPKAYQWSPAPMTSRGQAGHKQGMVAFDNSNFYYCKADYVDGGTDIWVKTAWTSTSW